MEPGSILEGKVTGITKFGAFVALEGGKSGLVHISEIANTFVSDVHDFLQEGQTVKVQVLSAENGKINLSIKRTVPQPERQNQPRRSFEKREPRPAAPQQQNRRPEQRSERPERPPQPEQFTRAYTPAPSKDQSFEDKLKQFMSESDSKLSSVRQYSEHKTKTRRR